MVVDPLFRPSDKPRARSACVTASPAEVEGFLESASALRPDPGHGDPVGPVGGNHGGDAAEALE